MKIGKIKEQGLYNKPSAAVHPGALAPGTLPQYNTIQYNTIQYNTIQATIKNVHYNKQRLFSTSFILHTDRVTFYSGLGYMTSTVDKTLFYKGLTNHLTVRPHAWLYSVCVCACVCVSVF